MAIDPDLKDWTWVTERPCPECGFDAREVPPTEVAGRLRQLIEDWRRLLDVDAAGLRRDDQVWSPLEYGCHIRDAFDVLDHRLVLMLSEDDPTFPNWDQNETALELDYLGQVPSTVAVELEASVARFADHLDSVTALEWQRTGTRSDGARFSVESLGRYALHEPIHHLADCND